MLGIVHHQIDKDRQETAKERRSVPHLVAVYIAVPGRAAVHQLVSQDVEPIEQDRQDPHRVVLTQGVIDGYATALEFVFPVLVAWRAVLMLPERMVDIAIVQKEADFLTEPLPNRVVDTVTPIELYERREKRLEEPTFTFRR